MSEYWRITWGKLILHLFFVGFTTNKDEARHHRFVNNDVSVFSQWWRDEGKTKHQKLLCIKDGKIEMI